MDYKIKRELGIAFENVFSLSKFLGDNNKSRNLERDAILDIIDASAKIICENKLNYFNDKELIDVRENVKEILEADVTSKEIRLLSALKKKLERMYKKVPFYAHGIVIGIFKLTVLECFGIWAIAIISVVAVQLFKIL